MARRPMLLATLFAVGQAAENQEIPGDKRDYFFPSAVPSSDLCGVNCYRVCEKVLGRQNKTAAANDCQKSCWAHSIQSTRDDEAQTQQGKYMQKVMLEYCDRKVCTGKEKYGSTPYGAPSYGAPSFPYGNPYGAPPNTYGAPPFPYGAPPPNPYGAPPNSYGAPPFPFGTWLQKEGEVQKHTQQEGESWGYPAQTKGWPKDPWTGKPQCGKKDYYCSELCQNMWHPVATNTGLGEHPGTKDWEINREQCNTDCNAHFDELVAYFDTFCACVAEKGPGAAPLPPGLLQEKHEEQVEEHLQVEAVDVGSFIQTSVEL